MTITLVDFSPEVMRSMLPIRIGSRINFNGPIPPDPFQPIDTPCWLWTGWCNDAGYGYTRWEGRDQPVHRVIHSIVTGEDLAAVDRDHVCRVPLCVRPSHGEPVEHAENMRRLSLHQKACRKAGHDWSDPKNVHVRPDGSRYCAECSRVDRRVTEKQERTHCPHGHAYEGDNLLIVRDPDGRFRQRVCRACRKARNDARPRKGQAEKC
jgi:hypothetical protein